MKSIQELADQFHTRYQAREEPGMNQFPDWLTPVESYRGRLMKHGMLSCIDMIEEFVSMVLTSQAAGYVHPFPERIEWCLYRNLIPCGLITSDSDSLTVMAYSLTAS